MATWKKVIVSASNAQLNNLDLSGYLVGQSYISGARIESSGAITGSQLLVTGTITGSIINISDDLFVGGDISGSNKLFVSLSLDSSGTNRTVVYNTSTKQFFYTGSYGGGGGGISTDDLYAILAGYADLGDNTFTGSQSITGSALLGPGAGNKTAVTEASAPNNNYALVVSQSSWSWNHNAGHPNSLAWGTYLEGSIFNTYNADTDIAEILRTILGIVSASHPGTVATPLPNSQNYAGSVAYHDETTITLLSTANSSITSDGYLARSYTASVASGVGYARYLQTKGFTDGPGERLFHNVTTNIYLDTDASLGILLSSSLGTTLFDAGLKDTAFTVFASMTQSFNDDNIYAFPTSSVATFTTRSLYVYTQTGAGDSNGIHVETVSTLAPTVIPPVYQAASFSNAALQLTRRYAATGESFTAASHISSSGYYAFYDIRAGIATGSTNINNVISGSLTRTQTGIRLSGLNTTASIFYTPLQATDISDNSPSIAAPVGTAIAAASRSLSGAPYLKTGTWHATNATASGLFDPLFYGSNANISDLTITANDPNVGLTATLAAKANTGVVTTGFANIYEGNTVVSIGSVPDRTSTCRFTGTASLSIGAVTNNNVANSGSSDVSFPLVVSSRTWKNITSTTSTTEVLYHTPGTFNQPSASGSMLVYATNDGFDPSNAKTESFAGETYRRTFGTPNEAGLSTVWNSGSRLALGDGGGLQVKPKNASSTGILVNPEQSGSATIPSGYWYPTTSHVNTHYKWYLREFDFTGLSGNATNLIVTLTPANTTNLTTFDDATQGKVAIGVIFEEQLPATSGETRTVMFDVFKGSADYAGTLNNQAPNTKTNPFSSNIDIKGLFSSQNISGGTITLGLNNAIFQKITSLSGNGIKMWMTVRYTGSPVTTSALNQITVATS